MRLLPLLFLFLSCLTGALRAQESLFQLVPNPQHPADKTRIQVEALFSRPAPRGFLPVRVTAVNQRKSDGEFGLRSLAVSGNQSKLDSHITLNLSAGQQLTRDLLIPLNTALPYYSEISCSINVEATGSFGDSNGWLQGEWSPRIPAVLLSESLYTPNIGELDKELNSSSGSRSYRTYSFAASFTPARMPTDWRAYSGYDRMILTEVDWNDFDPGARTAILEWCRLGGVIEILRMGDSSANLASLGIEPDTSEPDTSYGYGTILLGNVPNDLRLDAKSMVSRLDQRRANRTQNLDNDYSPTWPLQVQFGSRSFSYGIFIVVLILFGLLVGPINLFKFAKSGQRHRLFITTPIISIATCLILLILIITRDGLGGHGERMALIEVRPDTNENRAYIHQEQVSRSGVLLGSSFDLNEEALISPVPMAPGPWTRLTSDSGGEGLHYSANLKDGSLKLGGDWFRSRSEQGQALQAIVPTRGRIEVRDDAGTPLLSSTFEFPIESVSFVDADGHCWLVENLEAGRPVHAHSISVETNQQRLKNLMNQFTQTHAGILKRAGKRSDHFVAITQQAPAIETFSSIRWNQTTTVLTGPVVR
ncbi:hypothetical protein HNR46_000309 [Haloferula luteola]|uniref:Uncharacterized protein n=1 Tax=Haloferula luteola TaxID=595692 RepID=A0A840V5M3_9BACT|nr:hypothetical protein [Haloferula luteola]MBB5350088.1 hypothetical protein [Haloferula luteola]